MKTESIKLLTESVDETMALGRRIGAALKPGDVIALIGPLGAGKTHLVKGIADNIPILRWKAVHTFITTKDFTAFFGLVVDDAKWWYGSCCYLLGVEMKEESTHKRENN